MWYRYQLGETGETGGAVCCEVAGLPPVVHCGEQPADPLAGRDAEGRHVATGEREYRWRPTTGEIEEFGEPAL